MTEISRNPTRPVRIGTVTIGAGHPIAVQSMTATPTQDIDRTAELVNLLDDAGADGVHIDRNVNLPTLLEAWIDDLATIGRPSPAAVR